MSSPRLEAYQDAFGIAPDQLLALYESCDPTEWHPITHYQIQQLGAEAVQHAIFYSSYNHAFTPGSPVFTEARMASSYVAEHNASGSWAVNLEGRVRKPPRLTIANFGQYGGELGVFEEGLRELGIEDKAMKSPEPPKELAQEIAQEEGDLATLAYFTLRNLPQVLESNRLRAYPCTHTHVTAYEQAEVTGLPLLTNPARKIAEMWNDLHPPELHLVPGRVATPELVAALRKETTFLPSLKVAETDRNPIERVAVLVNYARQLGFAATFASDLEQGKHSVFGIGRAHALALSRWLERQADLDGNIALRNIPVPLVA